MAGQEGVLQPTQPGESGRVLQPWRSLHKSCTGEVGSASVFLGGCFAQPEVDFMKDSHVTL